MSDIKNCRIEPGMLLANAPGKSVLTHTTRVLAVDYSGDLLLHIAIPSPRSHLQQTPAAASLEGKELNGPEQSQKARKGYYLTAPALTAMTPIAEQVRAGQLMIWPRPKFAIVSDSDLIAMAVSDDDRDRIRRDLTRRDLRMSLVDLILRPNDQAPRRDPMELFRSGQLPQLCKQAAAARAVTLPHVYCMLHLYWANGSVANGLLPNFARCGAPGQEKSQNKPLGRKAKRESELPPGETKYRLTDDCKKKLRQGGALIGRETSERQAFDLTLCIFWADHVEDPTTGQTAIKVYSWWRHPTFEQFLRWGVQKRRGSETATKPRGGRGQAGGSEQDMVAGFGQQAAFDGTSTDLYLARSSNRLKKLPPCTRLILRETRLGIVYGFHVSWDAPSPATANLAILSGADPNKHLWINDRFGLNLQEGDIPAMLARTILADNGELKAQATSAGEHQFGYSIQFAPTNSGVSKSGVESNHRQTHRKLDHQLPGTTSGKVRSRGEAYPITDGLLTYWEYMRALIDYIVWINTQQEVPHLAPDDFMLQDPPGKPTRKNIRAWMVDRSMDFSLECQHECMKAFMLTEHAAVIRRNGVYLKVKIDGYEVVVPRQRYTSQELTRSGLLKQVHDRGRVIDVTVRLDKADLSRVYLPHPSGLMELLNVSRDESIKRFYSLDEFLSVVTEWREQRLSSGDPSEGRQPIRTLERAATVQAAKDILNQAMAAPGRRPSKAALKAGSRKNAEDESASLKASGHIPAVPSPLPTIRPRLQVSRVKQHAEDVMEQYHRESQRNAGGHDD